MKQLEKLNINWNYVVLGLSTIKNLNQPDLMKLFNVSHGTISNWINFHTTLDIQNKTKIFVFISRSELSICDLERIGKIDWKKIISYIKKELNIGDMLIASSLRITPPLVNSYSKKRTPKSKNRKLLLDLYRKIKTTKDKREIIREIYEKSFLNNKYGILLKSIRNQLDLNQNEMSKILNLSNSIINIYEKGHLNLSEKVFKKSHQKLNKLDINKKEVNKNILENKIKWIKSRKHPEIISFIEEKSLGTKFEIEVYNKLKATNYFKDIFLWPILSNEDLSFQFKADIYAIDKDNKHYLIDAKKQKGHMISREIKYCALTKEKIKEVDELVIITKKKLPLTSKHFKGIGIYIMSINEIKNLKEILNQNSPKIINNKLKNIRRSLNLSQYQFATLLNVDTKSIRNWENLKHKCKFKLNKKINYLQNTLTKYGSPYLQFKANKKLIIENIENINLRLLRCELSITQREFSKMVSISRRSLQDFEHGRIKSKNIKDKGLMKLKEIYRSKKDFEKLKQKTNKECIKYADYWKTAENITNIINIIPPYKNRGLKFEKEVESYFKSSGHRTIRNAILSNNNGTWYTEIDIVAIDQNDKTKLISCVESNTNTSYQRMKELKFIGNILNIKNLIVVCKDRTNSKIIDKWNDLGIKIIDNFKPSSEPYIYVQHQINY